MSVIKIRVDDQQIALTNMPVIASGGIEENQIEFEFSSDWAGFACVACFYRENQSYTSLVSAAGVASVPNEVVATDGKMWLGVMGVKDGVTKTSELVFYKILQGAITQEFDPGEPTPDIYNQILDYVSQVVDFDQRLMFVENQSSTNATNIATQTERIDNMINSQQNASVTNLWTGTLENKNQSVTLSQDISNFDFIDVYCGGADSIFSRKPVSNTTRFELQEQNMSDDASSQFLRWWETGLTISGTTATINKCIKCYWDDFSQVPVVSQATSGITIVRIDGVKIGHVENDEIVDARVGYDGAVYPNLGDAIRSQTHNLERNTNNTNIEGFNGVSKNEINISKYRYGSKYVLLSGTPYDTISILSGSNYAYFEVPVDGLVKITAENVFTANGIKGIVFADDDNTLIDYYPKENISAPGRYVNITCYVPENATKMYLQGTANPVWLFSNSLVFTMDQDKIKSSLDLQMTIEDYSTKKDVLSVITHENHAWAGNNPGSDISLNGWEYVEGSVEPGEILYISGNAGSNVPLFLIFDELGSVLYFYPTPSENTDYSNIKYVVPDGGVTIKVNGRLNYQRAGVLVDNPFIFVKDGNSMAVQLSENVYSVGTDDYEYSVDFFGSFNETFKFTNFLRNGSQFIAVGDDVTPLNFKTVGYLGANHGYAWVYDCTVNNHGLSLSDIGKTYVSGTNTWVLLQVKDANTIVVGNYDSSVWYKFKRDVSPTVLNFGTELSVSQSTLSQLYPSVKNVSVKLVKNTNEKAMFVETYNIIDVGVGVVALMENVGNNDNESITQLSDSLATVRNLYEFQKNGVVVIKGNVVLRKSERPLAFVGGVQSSAFNNVDTYYAVPLTTHKQLTLRSGSEVRFVRSDWDDSNKPPFVYEQAVKVNNNFASMFFTGYIIDDVERNELINNDAGFIYTSNKMYPYLIEPQTALPEGKSIDFTAFRVPAYVNELSNDIPFFNYFKVDDAYYLIIKTLGSLSVSLELPDEMCGMNVETLISEYVSTNTEIVVNALDVVATDEGTLFVKLSR